MELPRPLLPWANYLALFPREMALALGPLVQRLDLGIGPLAVSRRQGAGEVDGLDGIGRRGSYERLLLSEWLLADEVPEEFHRRVAMAEHSFLQLARREPAGTRTAVALFDGGPNQWGTPRIAHLAALIVLARRAEAGGARFFWGLLTNPEGTLYSEVTPETIRELLNGRSGHEATESDLHTWRYRFRQEAASDFWIVGGKRLTRWPEIQDISLLVLEDVYEPNARQLRAIFAGEAERRHDLILELPEDRLCAQLIRDPFDSERTKAAIVKQGRIPTSALLFAEGNNKVLARCGPLKVLTYPLPNSPRATPAPPKVYQMAFGRTVIAAGRIKKGIVLVSLNSKRAAFVVECFGGSQALAGEYEIYPRMQYPMMQEAEIYDRLPTEEEPLQPCYMSPRRTKFDEVELLVMTPNGRLFRLYNESGKRVARTYLERVCGLTPLGYDRMTYATWHTNRWMLESLTTEGPVARRPIPLFGPQVFCGDAGCGGWDEFGLVAYAVASNRWHIRAKEDLATVGDEQAVTITEGGTVVGVTIAPFGDDYMPALVVLESDRRTLSVLSVIGKRQYCRASGSIVHASVSPFASRVGCVTETGEVVIYALSRPEPIYRMKPEGA